MDINRSRHHSLLHFIAQSFTDLHRAELNPHDLLLLGGQLVAKDVLLEPPQQMWGEQLVQASNLSVG